MSEASAPVPNRNLGNTSLDMTQPDGIPRERERNADGTFKSDQPVENPPPASPSHPSYLTELARSFGFDEDDFEAMSSEALGRAVTKAQRRESEWRQSQVTPKAPEPEPEIDLGLNPEEYDEKVVGAFNTFKKLHGETNKELKALREELAQTKAREQERSRQQTIQLIDDAFEALGPEYEALFGKGGRDELRSSDPGAVDRRAYVLSHSKADASVTSGKALLAKLKASIATLYPNAKKAPEEPAKKRPTRDDWSSAGTAVPTQRESDQEPFGRDRAVKNAERRAKENGVAVAPSTAKEDAAILASFKRS